MNRNNTLSLGRLPSNVTTQPDSASYEDDSDTESTSSAAERLKWRDHPPFISPVPEAVESNPFEDLTFANGHAMSVKTTRDGSDAVEEVVAVDMATVQTVSTRGQDRGAVDPEKRAFAGENGAGGRGGASGVAKDGDAPESEKRKKLSFRERIRHFTWTWFCMTMATGGIANVLYVVPYRFNGIYALGCIFFILNIVLFLFNIAMISLRFYFYPKTFKASFMHPTESLFIPASLISFGTILINISQYGVDHTGRWLETVMVVLFWADCGLAIVFSIGILLIMWSTQTFTISQMTPVWIFPAYPLLIIGPHAGNLAPKVTSPERALAIIITGWIIQGIGFLVSLMIYSAYIYRLMTQKLPKESLRPGMFISVGPSGFTIAAIVTMGQQLPAIVPKDFMGENMGELAGNVAKICANWMGLWLWGLALWFFLISVGAHWSCAARGKMDFAMTWYSFIFPNTALTTATFAVASALDGDRGITYVGCAMTVGLVIVWFFVFGMMIRAVKIHQILWPQKQEDRTEGGFKQQSAEEQQRTARVARWDSRRDGPPDGGEDGGAGVYEGRWGLARRVTGRLGEGVWMGGDRSGRETSVRGGRLRHGRSRSGTV